MSRRDPGAATGRTRYTDPRTCRCGHLETVHTLRANGERGGVPGLLPEPCPGFRPVEEAA